eukprot:749928-Rhodomonas_salina.1
MYNGGSNRQAGAASLSHCFYLSLSAISSAVRDHLRVGLGVVLLRLPLVVGEPRRDDHSHSQERGHPHVTAHAPTRLELQPAHTHPASKPRNVNAA